MLTFQNVKLEISDYSNKTKVIVVTSQNDVIKRLFSSEF